MALRSSDLVSDLWPWSEPSDLRDFDEKARHSMMSAVSVLGLA